MVALPSGIRPDLTLEDREVKQQLGKCSPRAYSNMIRLDILGPSGVSPSCSPYLGSPPPPSLETFSERPLAIKPTQEELQGCVKLLAKKRRNIKYKAQDPPESNLPA